MLVHRGGSRDPRPPSLTGRGFCGAALQEKQQKPQCVWQHLCGVNRGELLEGPDRSTSELSVSQRVLRCSPNLNVTQVMITATSVAWPTHAPRQCARDESSSFLRLSKWLLEYTQRGRHPCKTVCSRVCQGLKTAFSPLSEL